MARLEGNVSPGFLLLTAFLFFAGGWAAVTAFCTAALAHELGHVTAMLVSGAHVRSVRLAASGPVIEYGGAVTRRQELFIVAAGPAAGLLFAILCFCLGTTYFCYVGWIAMLATAFNLLPALPLDGGRLAYALLCGVMPEESAGRALRIAGSACGCCAAVTGVILCSPAAAAAGIWLAVLANHPDLR